jgi:hypothetical protein
VTCDVYCVTCDCLSGSVHSSSSPVALLQGVVRTKGLSHTPHITPAILTEVVVKDGRNIDWSGRRPAVEDGARKRLRRDERQRPSRYKVQGETRNNCSTAYFLHHEQILSQIPNCLTTSTVVCLFIECQKQGGGGLRRHAAASEQRGRLIGELENFGGFGFRWLAAIKRALTNKG